MTYTKADLAKAFHVTEKTIQRLASAGGIPGRVRQRPALWAKPVIDEWVKEGCPGLLRVRAFNVKG